MSGIFGDGLAFLLKLERLEARLVAFVDSQLLLELVGDLFQQLAWAVEEKVGGIQLLIVEVRHARLSHGAAENLLDAGG